MGNPAKNKSQKHTEDGQIRGLQDHRKKECCNGQAASQLAYSQHCARHPGEGQGSHKHHSCLQECGIVFGRMRSSTRATLEYSVSSSLGKGCGPGLNLQEVGWWNES